MSRPAHNGNLEALRDRIRQLERPVRHGILPFGVAAIDNALPGGGLALGAVHEVTGAGGDEEDGAAAAGFLAGILARLGSGGPVLWCLKRPDLYGPGLLAHGLDPARLVLVAAQRDEAILWAIEEGLRAGRIAGLAAVVGEVGRLPLVAGRRLQLAAERSGVPAFILRRWRNAAEAAAERARPSTALTGWRIAALPTPSVKPLSLSPFQQNPFPHLGRGSERSDEERGGKWGLAIGRPRWRVELLRVRGGGPGSWEVEVADATGHVSVPAGLADRSAAPAEQKLAEQNLAERKTAGRRGEPWQRRAG
jgi:protein ImuA